MHFADADLPTETLSLVLPVYMRASSPVRWRVWTKPGCRPGSRCLCSAAPGPSACSRSAGSGRPCRPPRPAARVGGGTRQWPSQQPGGRCIAALGANWSYSTPTADPKHIQKHFRLASRWRPHDGDIVRVESGCKFSHLVVVSSGREVLVVRGPFETTHFLPVTLQPPLSRRRRPDVPLEDYSVPASRRQLLSIPCQGTLAPRAGGVSVIYHFGWQTWI